jgi:electron transport complex protein RnfG
VLKIKFFFQQSWLLIIASFLFGLLIAVANASWQGRILKNEEDKFNNLAKEMIPDANSFEIVSQEIKVDFGKGKQKAVIIKKAVADDGKCVGWAFKCEGSGFADKVKLVLTVDAGFEKLKGYGVLFSNETPGIGDQIKLPYYKNQFIGAPVEELMLSRTGDPGKKDSEIVAISKATVSSEAVVHIVNTFLPQIKNQIQTKGLIGNDG